MKHLIFFIFLFSSVTSVFSQKKIIETFYRGDNGIQYFIKPLVYQTVEKERLTIDFTLNVINDSVVKIVSNFSSQNNKIKYLLIGSSRYNVKKMFDDFETKKVFSRYTFNIELSDFRKIFSEKPINIKDSSYFLKKSFKKKTKYIRENFIPKLYN